ncbi:carbohydrate kinase [Wenjunlia vitaminophila]|uniref:Bifunctional NAD(P)H-hydrate repair enzyme n=1 Tax=Wenjunlia vitaminophila TaxID=76728 RepID=A0A0T6LLA0_WENVI|nr:bifunctional ADP-dependent NAD(P)H-hydrate dehydratase/NAD(P)H-hydrate epimerase [Wenjunlia vitaminophila]KRV46822.1 carbohydrate kinase [Wenjunlia vitaminophila]
MRRAHAVADVRDAEAALMRRLPEGTLMRRAAAGLAATCAGLLGRVYGSRVVLLVGSGDNGGDALYAGALLARRGAGVTAALLAPERAHPGGLDALRAAGGLAVTDLAAATRLIDRADVVLDGIVGIGGKGGLRDDAAPLAAAADRSAGLTVAVDLPSGIDPDTGEVPGAAVRADVTVTFGTHKPGLLVDPGARYAGAVRLVPIGIDPGPPVLEALHHSDLAGLLPVPGELSDKYRRGVVGVVAGSARYPGAAVLAVAGALAGAAGAVRYVGPAADAVVRRFPEVLVHAGPPADAGRVQAWVIGPGIGDGSGAREAIAQVLGSGVPVLVDADGLALLRDTTVEPSAELLLTPHAGEAAALLGTDRAAVEAARLAHVRELARARRATVLLKGSTTLVADPVPAPVRVNPTGTGWLATAGSGDVLSGLAGSLLAAGLTARDAGSVAAYLHGLAARRATGVPGAPITAMDVAAALPGAWRDAVTPG